jgi:hypothetical protein
MHIYPSYQRDPVECVKELMGNPAFKDMLKYAPERHFADLEGKICMIDEMWTAKWWWDTQVKSIYLAVTYSNAVS